MTGITPLYNQIKHSRDTLPWRVKLHDNEPEAADFVKQQEVQHNALQHEVHHNAELQHELRDIHKGQQNAVQEHQQHDVQHKAQQHVEQLNGHERLQATSPFDSLTTSLEYFDMDDSMLYDDADSNV